jgi:LuxR family maltose regulon positive regulatory protein
MTEIGRNGLPEPLLARSMLAEATLLARLGEPRRARAILDELGSVNTEPVMLGVARLLLQLDDRRGVLALRRLMVAMEHPRALVEVGLLDTALALAAGDDETALERLEDALVAAAPRSLRHPFLVEAPLIRPLLERRLERGTLMPAFTVDLLGRTSRDADIGTASSADFELPTRRERTVLRYLASTMSNAEIAEALYLSVNTVKTHERALYRKLRAANRREAVARARALDLL